MSEFDAELIYIVMISRDLDLVSITLTEVDLDRITDLGRAVIKSYIYRISLPSIVTRYGDLNIFDITVRLCIKCLAVGDICCIVIIFIVSVYINLLSALLDI